MEKELQQKYVQMQMLDQQIKQAQKQVQQVEQQAMELIIAIQALDEINGAKTGSEILVPIANGIFAKAELKDNSDLILNVGANTAVVKDVSAAKNLLDTQLAEMRSVQEQLMQELHQMVSQAKHLELEIMKAKQA